MVKYEGVSELRMFVIHFNIAVRTSNIYVRNKVRLPIDEGMLPEKFSNRNTNEAVEGIEKQRLWLASRHHHITHVSSSTTRTAKIQLTERRERPESGWNSSSHLRILQGKV